MSEGEGAKQYTALGLLALVCALIPIAGFFIAKRIEHRTQPDTNANTLAMIAAILSVWVIPALFTLMMVYGYVFYYG